MYNSGKVFAFKTDTVWGFGCHPKDIEAIKKIYEIKKRDERKPLILMSYALEPLLKYIKNIPFKTCCFIAKTFINTFQAVLY